MGKYIWDQMPGETLKHSEIGSSIYEFLLTTVKYFRIRILFTLKFCAAPSEIRHGLQVFVSQLYLRTGNFSSGGLNGFNFQNHSWEAHFFAITL